MIAGAGLNDRATVEFVVEQRAGGDRAAGRARRAVQRDGEERALAPDPRGRPQPPPHRPCRRRDRLGGAAGAGEGRRRASQHHAHPRHGRDRPRHRPPARALLGRRPCLGRLCAQPRDADRSRPSPRRATILATGGAGRVYLFSTAPRGATGDGIAMAWRAGCRVSNMEFMQFHPTCLYNLEVKNFLITEAVRGEGGQLKHPDDRPPLHARFRRARGARAARRRRPRDRPRDQAARPRLRPSRHQPPRRPNSCREHFPNIHARLLEPRHRHHQGADPGRARRSIIPAAAWSSTSTGGPICPASTRSARSASRACTAPTGSPPIRCSNASCSARPRRAISPPIGTTLPPPPPIRAWDESRVTDSDEEVVIQQNWTEIRRFMWNYVGIVRTTKRLERAPAPDQAADRRRSRIITAISGSRRTWSSCATCSRAPS